LAQQDSQRRVPKTARAQWQVDVEFASDPSAGQAVAADRLRGFTNCLLTFAEGAIVQFAQAPWGSGRRFEERSFDDG
jgi:hypothetical protein